MGFNYYSANLEMRPAIMDFRRPDEMARFRRLVAGVDVFFANRRPGLLEKLGTPGFFAVPLVPRGSSKAEWLAR
jgi:hypothetical protein